MSGSLSHIEWLRGQQVSKRAPSSQKSTEKPKGHREAQRASSGQKSDERLRGLRMTERVRLRSVQGGTEWSGPSDHSGAAEWPTAH